MTFILRCINVEATSCGHMTFIQRHIHVDASSWKNITFIHCHINVYATSCRNMTFIQCRIKVDATSWRHDVASTLMRRCINGMCSLGTLQSFRHLLGVFACHFILNVKINICDWQYLSGTIVLSVYVICFQILTVQIILRLEMGLTCSCALFSNITVQLISWVSHALQFIT